MIADTSPLGHIGPITLPIPRRSALRLPHGDHHDRLRSFFSNLTWTDRQILALYFAEGLTQWEIHVVLNMSMNDVLCRIMRLRKIAHKSLLDSSDAVPAKLKLKTHL